MAKLKDQIRSELKELINQGITLYTIESNKQKKSNKSESSEEITEPIAISYQAWYTQALPVGA